MTTWRTSHAALLLRRLLLLYAAMAVCRVVFYLYNYAAIGPLTDGWSLWRGALKFDTASLVYADGFFVLLSLIPLRIRVRKWWRAMLFWYFIVVNSVAVIGTNLADAIYFRYTQKRITAEEIFFADNANTPLLMARFALENWYLVLLFGVMVWGLVRGYGRKIVPPSSPNSAWYVYYPIQTLLLALALTGAVWGVRGGLTRMTRPITLTNASAYAATPEQVNLILSNPFCILRTIGNGSTKPEPYQFSEAEADRIYSPEHRPTAPDSTVLSDRNVVVFILESFSAENSASLMPSLYGPNTQAGQATAGRGYTPFLDSLMNRGVALERMYAVGTRSIQAMPAVLGGIPSFKTPFVLMPAAIGRSHQLPAMLADRGYHTLFFCGSELGSMGFDAYARQAGVQEIVAREDYEAAHGKDDFDGAWGIWDGPFLQFMGERLSTVCQPFMATVFTITSHHPFQIPSPEGLPEGVTKVQRPIAYTDASIARFYRRFQHEPWFRNTIFVFVADHVSSEKMSPITRTFPENHHVLGVIHTPDGALKPRRLARIVQQTDIMPTLLGLLGNRTSYLAFGRDIFAEPDRPPMAVIYDSDYRVVGDSLPENLLRAVVEQYNRRIERMDYTVAP